MAARALRASGSRDDRLRGPCEAATLGRRAMTMRTPRGACRSATIAIVVLGAALTALPAPTAPGTDAGADDTGDR